jgi:2'-5' RNA ligase
MYDHAMRLFAAIELPAEARDAVAAWWAGASLYLQVGEWRDVPKPNWHLTLAFYGEVNGNDVDDLAEALAECAGRFSPLNLRFSECGVFPGLTRPKVFWLGVEDEENRLRHLARCCRQAGHATVRKSSAKENAFHGHITLARRRDLPGPLAPEVFAHMPSVPETGWCADRFSLIRSQLHHDGARYRVVEDFDIAGDAAQER